MEVKKGDRVIIGPDMQQNMERYRGKQATVVMETYQSRYCEIIIDDIGGPFGTSKKWDTWTALIDHLLPVPNTNRKALPYLKK